MSLPLSRTRLAFLLCVLLGGCDLTSDLQYDEAPSEDDAADMTAPDLSGDDGLPPEDMAAVDQRVTDMPPDECAQDEGCGEGERCVEGTCYDLFNDTENCGAPGRACPEGSACVAGMCLCGDRAPVDNYTVIASTEADGLRHYPAPQLFPVTSIIRYVCSESDKRPPCPPGEQVELDQRYPPDAPHYLAIFSTARDALGVRVVTEQGATSEEPPARIAGVPSSRFSESMIWRVQPDYSQILERTVIWVLWRDDEPRQGDDYVFSLRGYAPRANEEAPQGLSFEQLQQRGEPLELLRAENIVDFTTKSERFVRGGLTLNVQAIPHVRVLSETGSSAPPRRLADAELHLSLLVQEQQTLSEDAYVLTLPEPVALGGVRQSATGFDVHLSERDGQLLITVTLLAADEESSNEDFLGTAYHQYHFISRREQTDDGPRFGAPELLGPARVLGKTLIPRKILGDLIVGDLSEMPPPAISAFKAPHTDPTQDLWNHLMWLRLEAEQGGQFTVLQQLTTPTAPAPLDILSSPSRGIYDAVMTRPPLRPVLFWLETDMTEGGDYNRLRSDLRYTVLPNGAASSEVGEIKPLGEPFGAHRLSRYYGTRSVGLLVHGSVAPFDYEARFYAFAAEQPFCDLAPDPR